MKKRYQLPARKARKMFTRTAGPSSVHVKNLFGSPMRGGIRL